MTPRLACALALLAATGLTGCNTPPGVAAAANIAPPAAGFGSTINGGTPAVPAATAGAAAGAGTALGGAAPTAAAGATIATANGLTLTQDNLDAYLDALDFSLAQVGQTAKLTAAQRTQIAAGLGAGFAKLKPVEQQALVTARAAWTATQARWATMSPAEQKAFVSDVLTIGVGEAKAKELLGGGGSASGGGSGGGKADCEQGNFDDQMFNCYGIITPSVPWNL